MSSLLHVFSSRVKWGVENLNFFSHTRAHSRTHTRSILIVDACEQEENTNENASSSTVQRTVCSSLCRRRYTDRAASHDNGFHGRARKPGCTLQVSGGGVFTTVNVYERGERRRLRNRRNLFKVTYFNRGERSPNKLLLRSSAAPINS